MIINTQPITGTSLPATAFRLHETERVVDTDAVFDVLHGELAAYRIRGFVPPDVCDRIVQNFWSSDQRVPRYGEGQDGVEAYLIGASHYGKPTMQYLEEVRDCREAVESLYAGTVSPISAFRGEIASDRRDLTGLRPAAFDGLDAGDSKAVYWNDLGNFLLKPHDDLAQAKDPIQYDFEIQEAVRVMALNVYAQVPSNAGQLKVWNIEPDDETRAELGLTNVGFPYPAEPLDDFSSIIIPVESGDLCVVNGNLVHAVLRGDPGSSRNRLLITCFMTVNLANELIWWT
jgi:hypothetical protein